MMCYLTGCYTLSPLYSYHSCSSQNSLQEGSHSADRNVDEDLNSDWNKSDSYTAETRFCKTLLLYSKVLLGSGIQGSIDKPISTLEKYVGHVAVKAKISWFVMLNSK